MFKAAMVENHVHDNLQSFLMGFVTQATILFVRAKTWVYTVVVCGCIAMIGALRAVVGRVILQNRCKPQGSYTQFFEVIEMLTYSFQVATMAQTRLCTVVPVSLHALDLVIVCATRGKAVGHQHVEYIGIAEALAVFTFHFAGFQFIFDLLLRLSLSEVQDHLAGLGTFQIHVYQQVVGTVQSYETVNFDTWVIGCYICCLDAFSVNHELQAGIFHAGKPVARFNLVYLYSCIHTQCSAQKEGG